MSSYRLIHVIRLGDVGCIRLRNTRLEENEIQQFGEEVLQVCQQEGINRLALSLGPDTPRCLYSVFLAKLISLRNAIQRQGGQLVLCEVNSITFSAFEACGMDTQFTFLADFDAARNYFSRQNGQVSSN